MSLSDRILNAIIYLPTGFVKLDETINLHIRIHKQALSVQNRAIIEVYGLTQSLREQLLSQFSLWNRQVALQNPSSQWVNVEINAGMASSQSFGTTGGQQLTETVSRIFKGQVAYCEPISNPPNVGIRITCYTRQIDKSSYPSAPAPYQDTLKGYVTWAAAQMGFGKNFICDTSHNDKTANNIGGAIYTQAAILPAIQDAYMPDVAAFIDDDFLIVKDRSKILDPNSIQPISQFIGIPSWTEYGIQFTTLFSPVVRLAQGVTVTSQLNPSLNGTYVVMELEYDLSSRDQPFYCKVYANPPA